MYFIEMHQLSGRCWPLSLSWPEHVEDATWKFQAHKEPRDSHTLTGSKPVFRASLVGHCTHKVALWVTLFPSQGKDKVMLMIWKTWRSDWGPRIKGQRIKIRDPDFVRTACSISCDSNKSGLSCNEYNSNSLLKLLDMYRPCGSPWL